VYPRHGYAPYGYRYSGYAYGYHHRHCATIIATRGIATRKL